MHLIIPCECGRSYYGETGSPLAVWLQAHGHNLKDGLIEKFELDQHDYEECHQIRWNEDRIQQIETNNA
jgi:hypothetical protein